MGQMCSKPGWHFSMAGMSAYYSVYPVFTWPALQGCSWHKRLLQWLLDGQVAGLMLAIAGMQLQKPGLIEGLADTQRVQRCSRCIQTAGIAKAGQCYIRQHFPCPGCVMELMHAMVLTHCLSAQQTDTAAVHLAMRDRVWSSQAGLGSESPTGFADLSPRIIA